MNRLQYFIFNQTNMKKCVSFGLHCTPTNSVGRVAMATSESRTTTGVRASVPNHRKVARWGCTVLHGMRPTSLALPGETRDPSEYQTTSLRAVANPCVPCSSLPRAADESQDSYFHPALVGVSPGRPRGRRKVHSSTRSSSVSRVSHPTRLPVRVRGRFSGKRVR